MGLPLEEIGTSQLVCTHSRCSTSKGGCIYIYIFIEQLENEATPEFKLVAISEFSFFLGWLIELS